MEDFRDFVSSISEADVASIIDDASAKAAEARKRMSPESPDFFGNQLGVISYTIALELLGLYHKWLQPDEPD